MVGLMVTVQSTMMIIALTIRPSASWQLPNSLRSRLHSNYSPVRLHSSIDGGDPVLRLPLMEAELAALEGDSKVTGGPSSPSRADLEESIDNARTAAEFGVRRAQVQFYDAFSTGNLDTMGAVWSEKSHVRCIHPGMSSLEGREEVMRSWAQILSGPMMEMGFTIEPSRVRIEICGRTAMCSCIEGTPGGGKLEALNVYQREEGGWRMTLHMASPIAQQLL